MNWLDADLATMNWLDRDLAAEIRMIEALRRARRRRRLGDAEPIDAMWQALREQRAAGRDEAARAMIAQLGKVIGFAVATLRRQRQALVPDSDR